MIAALLEERYGVRVRFLETSVVCIERVTGTGAAVDRIRERGNPYLAGLGLRIEAAPVGHGVEFSPGIERGNLPPAFVAATEEGVRAALRQGLHGWPVTDCVVTMTSSAYWPRQSRPHQKFDKSISSVAADFRQPRAGGGDRGAGRRRHPGVPADRRGSTSTCPSRPTARWPPARPARRGAARDDRRRRYTCG